MQRLPSTAWKKGQSGNPKGRPRGSTPSAALRDAIKQAMPAVLQALIAKATAGDVNAAIALAKMALPPLRASEEAVPINLPTGDSLTQQGQAVLDAIGRGEIGPHQGQALLSALADLAKLRESDDHEQRLRALEELQQGAPTWHE